MISGKLAIGGLSLEFGQAQKRFERLTSEVDELATEETRLVREERELVEELARLYLPELSPEAVSSGIADLESEMAAALARQAEHRARLARRLEELPEDVGRRELLLAEAERAEERAAGALLDVQRAVEAELGELGEYRTAAAEHAAHMERRSILKTRGARLQTVANVERHRYEADPAFAYLHRRAYGEPGYRAGPLGRWMDGWLARRIGFDALRQKYRVLRTGPHTIRSEIRELTHRAEALEETIDRHESAAGERLGLLPALEAAEAAQRAVVDARTALREARARHDRIAAEIRAVDANRGRPYEEAIETHRVFLADQSVRRLMEIARGTADPMDDGLVSRLDGVRDRLEEIGPHLVRLREQLEDGAERARSLGEVAREAASRFTSRRSFFPEELGLEKLVESLLDGGTSAGDALRSIAESHVSQPLLVASDGRPELDGLFAELSGRFDPELGAVEVRVEEGTDLDSEIVVYDHHGRVLHRRVTRRGGRL